MYCHYVGINVGNPKFYSLMVSEDVVGPFKTLRMSKADVNSKSRPLNLHRVMFYFKNHYGPTKENWI